MVGICVKKPPLMPHAVGVEVLQDVSRIASPVDGFVRRYRHRAKTRLSDGTRTEAYVADYIDRAPGRRDAVAVVVYIPDPQPGRSLVILRQQLRYPVWIATGAPLMTEVVAGVLEGDERPEDTARREVAEETGLSVDADAVVRLGGPFYPSPGVMTEMVYVVAARLPPDTLNAPLPVAPGDGSPMEDGARLIAVALDDALALPSGPPTADVDRVTLCDAKSEIALRRLREWLGKGAA